MGRVIQEIKIPAKLCTCEAILSDGQPCGYSWISIAVNVPTHCQNRDCRSREWNGKKAKRKPAPKPKVVLPKPVKVRGEEEDEF